MSVLASKRGISDMEFYKNAVEIRNEVTDFLLRDFGIKNLKESSDNVQWYINDERSFMMKTVRDLIINIVRANNIYVYTTLDHDLKRAYQNLAINAVYTLYEEFANAFMRVQNVKLHKRCEYFLGMLEKELVLLKAWRKKNKKVKNLTNVKENNEIVDKVSSSENDLDKYLNDVSTISHL
jgi:hypothetical protein